MTAYRTNTAEPRVVYVRAWRAPLPMIAVGVILGIWVSVLGTATLNAAIGDVVTTERHRRSRDDCSKRYETGEVLRSSRYRNSVLTSGATEYHSQWAAPPAHCHGGPLKVVAPMFFPEGWPTNGKTPAPP